MNAARKMNTSAKASAFNGASLAQRTVARQVRARFSSLAFAASAVARPSQLAPHP